MPKFRKVEVWPSGGWPDKPWCKGKDSADRDAFARVTRGICELYSEALPGLNLTGKGLLRLNIETVSSRPKIELVVSPAELILSEPASVGSLETLSVAVPVGFADQSVDEQRRLGLRIVHEGAIRLARARGWDPTVLASALQYVEAQGFCFRLQGPWKTAPDRRHRARAVAHLADDGIGRVHLEVVDRAGEVIASGEDVLASSDGDDLKGACKTVRWDGSTRVSMIAIMDEMGIRQSQPEIDLSGDRPLYRTVQQKEQIARISPPVGVRASKPRKSD